MAAPLPAPPESKPPAPPLPNRNITLQYVFAFISSLSSAIVFGPLFSNWIDIRGGSLESVGNINAAFGVSMLAAALPVGWFTDRCLRVTMLRAGAAVGAGAIALFALALLIDSTPLLYLACGAYGAFSALTSAPLAALLADSTESSGEGEESPLRTLVFVRTYTLSLVASATGPLLTIFGLLVLGDTWSLSELRNVLLAGNLLAAASLVVLLSFTDEPAASAALSERALQRAQKAAAARAAKDAAAGKPPVKTGPSRWVVGGKGVAVPLLGGEDGEAPLDVEGGAGDSHPTSAPLPSLLPPARRRDLLRAVGQGRRGAAVGRHLPHAAAWGLLWREERRAHALPRARRLVPRRRVRVRAQHVAPRLQQPVSGAAAAGAQWPGHRTRCISPRTHSSLLQLREGP